MSIVQLQCKTCHINFVALYKERNSKKFCSLACRCKGMSGKGNPAYGKTYRTKETHPEWAAKVSQTSKSRKINSGDKNGMKNPVAASKASATRKKRFQNQNERDKVAEITAKAWADGKYDGVSTGKCKWYDHVTPSGDTVKLQGTWEVAFARRMDQLGIKYITHKGRWPYLTEDNIERSYYPDFYIPMFDTYIDVKGAFWDEQQAIKFKYVKMFNQDKNIFVATRNYLDEWYVDIKGTQEELLPHLKYIPVSQRNLEAST